MQWRPSSNQETKCTIIFDQWLRGSLVAQYQCSKWVFILFMGTLLSGSTLDSSPTGRNAALRNFFAIPMSNYANPCMLSIKFLQKYRTVIVWLIMWLESGQKETFFTEFVHRIQWELCSKRSPSIFLVKNILLIKFNWQAKPMIIVNTILRWQPQKNQYKVMSLTWAVGSTSTIWVSSF